MAYSLNSDRKTAGNTRGRTSEREVSEYDGLWVNVGVQSEEVNEETGETEIKFNRIPRGIAVADFVDHRVFASSNPQWAKEANLINGIMDLIREAGLELEEGESKPLNLSVQLYRRQETVEAAPAPAASKDKLKSQLFG